MHAWKHHTYSLFPLPKQTQTHFSKQIDMKKLLEKKWINQTLNKSFPHFPWPLAPHDWEAKGPNSANPDFNSCHNSYPSQLLLLLSSHQQLSRALIIKMQINEGFFLFSSKCFWICLPSFSKRFLVWPHISWTHPLDYLHQF
jgi:hypothetical protein